MNGKYSLLETGTLPSDGSFAECILSGTRQRWLCQVFFSALCKNGFAECFLGTQQRCILPGAIFRHSAKCVFAECLFLALSKDVFCRVPFFGTWQNASLPSAFFGTRRRGILLCAFFFGPRQIIFSKQFLRPEMNSNEKLFNYKVV